MKKKVLLLTSVFMGFVACQGAGEIYSSGLNQQTLSGSVTWGYQAVSGKYVQQNGLNFTAGFTDLFGQQWVATADFQNNNQIVFQFSSPNPSANIGAGDGYSIMQWQFWGFGFQVQNLQGVALPPGGGYPYDRSLPSFDNNDVWMGFDGLAAYAPYNYYAYQITPISTPEPTTSHTLLLGIVVGCVAVRRSKRRLA
jgi:hypothetical protein